MHPFYHFSWKIEWKSWRERIFCMQNYSIPCLYLQTFEYIFHFSMKKYETHPPIHKGSASKSSSQERCVIVEERPSANDDIKPLPPRSFVSHLGVGVPTHSAEECQQMISTADKLSSIFKQRRVDIFLWAIILNVENVEKEFRGVFWCHSQLFVNFVFSNIRKPWSDWPP